MTFWASLVAQLEKNPTCNVGFDPWVEKEKEKKKKRPTLINPRSIGKK